MRVRKSSVGAPNDRPVSLAEAVLVARGLFPHAEVRRVATPAGENGTYRINLRRPGDANIRHPTTLVWIDRWSGQIRAVRNPNTFTAGQTFVSRIWPWHTGEVFGPLGRFLWFLTGLTPLVLYVSGLFHWLYRRGSVKDREVNLTALRPKLERAWSVLLRHSAALFHVFRFSAGWALVRLMRFAQWGKQRYLD